MSLISKYETCAALQVCEKTLELIVQRGKLTKTRNGKRVYFQFSEVDALRRERDEQKKKGVA